MIKLSPLVSNADVKWSMAGPDRDAFYFWVVNEKHGLYFTPQDYENPEDADGDNVYSIVLTATDPDSGGKTTIDFTVTVVNDPDDDSGDLPVLSVRPLPGIVEGGQVRFVVTADPAPAYKTAVNVRVNQDGNFLFWHSRQITVWLPTSGRATFAILTRDDKTDEPDGSVSVTLRPGVGYTVAADKGTASVRVADNDGLPSAPEVNITASQGGSEGENVTFTLTATPAPASDLAVPVTVAAGGDFGVSTGSHTVTIPTSGSATLTIATTDDDADEPDGSVTLSLTDGDGYIVGPWSTETIAVLDNDDAALVTSEVSVTSGGDITEGASAQFTVTANPAPSAPLTVNLTVGQEGQYGAVTGTQTVTVPTSGSATFTVSTTDDETHESDGSISVTVDAGGGYTVSATQGAASVVVSDNDEAPEKAEKDGAGTADVDLGEVEVGQRISYVPPSLKPAGAEDCSIGAGVLWKSVEGGEVVTSLDNGFSLDYDSGLPKLSGRAKFRAAPTVYRIEYICGSPQSWSASYTISVEVIGAGMGFDADSLGLRTLYRDQPRTVNPPQLFNAEGAVTYAVSPALPAGLSLDTATGVISGAPTTLQEQVTYTVTATDSKPGGAQTATFDVRLSVVLGMHWSTSSMPDMVFEAGERIEIVPPALVNPTTQLRYTYRATHSGVLTMHPYSGRLLASSARPMVKNTYTITAYEARVYDDRTPQRVSITVNVEVQEVHRFGAGQTVSIPAMALPGLSGTISYALAGTPALPNGLSFDSNSGVISGTLDANATQTKQTYTITGTDENGNTADYRFKIEVRKLVLSGTQAGYSVGAGDALSISPTHSGGIGAVSYSISPAPSELPGGVSFNAETGAISGTPSLEFAEKAFTVTATDSANPPQTAGYSVSIRVNPSAKAPRVSISAGSGVTEGAGAGFTVTAVPAPSAPLAVTVTVTQDGDYGATTGSRTVTIPTSGSATLTISTTDDNADEPNGSVSVTVDAGETYSVSATQTAATVSVADNDEAPGPEVSVTAGSGITEGGDARFTVSASPAPSEDLAVSVTVTQDGDYGATTGSRTVTIPTSGSTTLTVSTTNDDADETDGSVSVAVDAGDGYTVSGA
ncbi:MAG: putative Ig domain-containing protein, partial [bacterium]|nr:putative Ig domain-containing protein [bacterium]